MISETRDKTRLFEIVSVICTGLLKFFFVDILNAKFIFIVSAVLFWTGYLGYRFRKDNNILAYWGFSGKNLKSAFVLTGIFALICSGIMLLYALVNGTRLFNIHLIYILLLYPIWGLIQQFLIMSLIAGNLDDLKSIKVHPAIIYMVSALLFSTVHLPSLLLVAGTFILALFYIRVFLIYRNLFPLGLFHGWLGALFYFWVLNRDPWLEFITLSIK